MPPSFVQSIESMSFGTLFTASKLTWTTGHWKTLIFHLRTHASEVLLWPSKMIKFGNLLAKDFWKLFSRGFFSRKNASCIIHRPRLSTSLTRIRNLWGSQYSNLLQIVGEQVQHLPEMVILIKFIDFTKLQNQQTTHLQPTSKPPWNHHFLHGYQPTNFHPSPLLSGFPDRCAGAIFFEVHHGIHEIRRPMFLPNMGRKTTWETMGWWTLTSKLKKKQMVGLEIDDGHPKFLWNDWLGTHLFCKWLTWFVGFLVSPPERRCAGCQIGIDFPFYRSFEVKNSKKKPLKALPSWRWWNNRIQNKELFEKWKKTHF